MQEGRFVLKSPFKPQGDQPQAIEALTQGVQSGMPCQVLLGVTGSGKTYTMASVIERVQRPTLVIAHNKTLAAQLCAEFREFFPDSAVEYFVSYYDYYQPEAYIASTDTYIEKDSAVNEEIERLRHSATAALRERRDVIVVASVSCIYSMGDPSEYEGMMISLRPGMAMERDELVRQLGRNSVRPQATSSLSAAPSACAATWWKSSPPDTTRARSAWNFSATKSTASAPST